MFNILISMITETTCMIKLKIGLVRMRKENAEG